jgi:hypothetical protein
MPQIYVIDTHVLVWYLEGRLGLIGKRARAVLLQPSSCLVIPIYCFEEIRFKFPPKRTDGSTIRVPPSAALRLLAHAVNVRIFPRGPGVLAEANRLRKSRGLSAQDLPIYATAVAIEKATGAEVFVLSNDEQIRRSKLVRLAW